MQTRILMTASACLMGALGLAATFLPQELLTVWGSIADDQTVLIVQIAGALYLGFAMLNWGARGLLIGGIYARPLAMANFLHFTLAAITLIREAFSPATPAILVVTAVYTVFSAWFGFVVFTHPRGSGGDS